MDMLLDMLFDWPWFFAAAIIIIIDLILLALGVIIYYFREKMNYAVVGFLFGALGATMVVFVPLFVLTAVVILLLALSH